jgi:hypothetical protein
MHEAKSKEEHLDSLKADLNGWMPAEGNVEEMLAASAESMAEFDKTKNRVGNALNIQTAETIKDLEAWGEVVKEYPDQSDSVELYKKKILTKFQQLSVAGRPNEILDYTADLLGVEPSKIQIQNVEDTPNFKVTVPSQAIADSVLSSTTVGNLLTDVGAATYGAIVPILGSLEYISETEYNNSNYDTSKGYATLDTNDNITSGGTYGTAYQ